MKKIRPTCPYCGQVMVRAHIEDDKGDWCVVWLCECQLDERYKSSEAEAPLACPYCKAPMVQMINTADDIEDWSKVYWLCECQPDPSIINSAANPYGRKERE